MKRSNMRDSRPEDITKIRLEKRKNEYDEYIADSECETWDEIIEEIKIKDAIEDFKARK